MLLRAPIPILLTLAALLGPGLPSQADWQKIPSATGPGCMTAFGFTYDTRRKQALMFGGFLQSQNCSQPAGKWDATVVYDGKTWRTLAPSTVPPGRFGFKLAYDMIRDRTVMFGGCSGFHRQETWEWDGNDWQQLLPNNSPPALCAYGMTFELASLGVLLFGGGNGAGTRNETWLWNGRDWQQKAPTNSPSPRTWPAMCFDFGRGRVLLFGGDTNSVQLNDTWEWDGSNWTQRFPKNSPSPRARMDMVYDVSRDRVVLFGGFGSGATRLLNDTWEWDGNDWHLRSPKTSPPGMWEAATVYDVSRQRTVVFGGGGTWEYGSPNLAQFTVYGAACPGTQGTPVLTGWQLPWLGDTMDLQLERLPARQPAVLALGLSKTRWGAATLPLALGSVGMPGCSLFTSLDALYPLNNSGTIAKYRLRIPPDPRLIGVRFYNQGFVADPKANAQGIIATNASEGLIGAR